MRGRRHKEKMIVAQREKYRKNKRRMAKKQFVEERNKLMRGKTKKEMEEIQVSFKI